MKTISNPTLIPVFDGQVNFFTIPQKLTPEEAKQFLDAARTIEDCVDSFDEKNDILELTFETHKMTKNVFDEITKLCKSANMNITSGQDSGEYILAIHIN